MSLKSSRLLKEQAHSLGFFACGIARAMPVDETTATHYRQWLAEGNHADMGYLANNLDKRLNPTLLLPGARSIIVVALNYAPARHIPKGEYQIAAYAYGRDYHDVVKEKLRQLVVCSSAETVQTAQLAGEHSKVCVDTVPILERYWAWKAGLGFLGRNHQLIIPQAGSMFFLGEIVTTDDFDQYDEPMTSLCGNCQRCIDACPTGALTLQPSAFNAKNCLSYQTIENRGALDEETARKLGDTIYGCDRCQQACPWNRFAQPNDTPDLQPSEDLLAMRRADWEQLTQEQYQRLFKGSAVKRAKYDGLLRNIKAVAKGQDSI